jgi:GT2 family glycosyltransferase
VMHVSGRRSKDSGSSSFRSATSRHLTLRGRADPVGIVLESVIAIVVLTHNRAHLLRRCVEDVLLRTSSATREIVIWDNASTDETRTYLATVTDPRLTLVHHEANIGTSAYVHAVAMTSSRYIVELDDDVIEAPPGWDSVLLEAFQRIPNLGTLAADLKEDPNDSAYCYLQYVKETRNVFERKEVDGLRILEGPTHGGCTMTSRDVYETVGGFRQNRKLVFWHEDDAYVRQVRKRGYRTAILEDLEVWHAGSPYYSKPSEAKVAFHKHHARSTARRNRVKKAILRLPFAAALNTRFDLFSPPYDYKPPEFGRAPE